MKNIYLNNDTTDLLFENADDGKFIITGYAALFNHRNLNDEIVLPTSFDQSISMFDEGKLTPYLNYEHQGDKVVGGIDGIGKDSKGLIITAHLNRKNKWVDEWLCPAIENGDIKSFSTEGTVRSADDIVWNTDESYTVKNFLLLGCAITKTPAEWNSTFSIANAFKAFQQKTERKWYLL